MRSSRLTSAALVALAGTAITHMVLTHRRHRDRTVLEAAHLHQRLLAAQVERPGLRAIWGSLDPLEPAERRLHLHRNAWVSAWEAMFRVGVLSADGVHGAALALFATPGGQKWWTGVRDSRAQAVGEGYAHRFHTLVDTAYQDATGDILPTFPSWQAGQTVTSRPDTAGPFP
ncbi:DUF6082 family protein [Streptomyces sp. GQFP]|uniref:DUF6082 family protein n=1 Tax=Streptomyces sp. GQFP TaxID=2907545 RepID=UPI001F335605|nr:DUF6082 family protein [Streptomyces sp. GQFP]UIX34485.1 DUF6082 family protein [Streptomyces sp. GQFP]